LGNKAVKERVLLVVIHPQTGKYCRAFATIPVPRAGEEINLANRVTAMVRKITRLIIKLGDSRAVVWLKVDTSYVLNNLPIKGDKSLKGKKLIRWSKPIIGDPLKGVWDK